MADKVSDKKLSDLITGSYGGQSVSKDQPKKPRYNRPARPEKKEKYPTSADQLIGHFVRAAGERAAGLLPMAARLVGGAASTPGGYFGAGASGAGETIAQMIEKRTLNPGDVDYKKVGVEAGLGLIPFNKTIKAGKALVSAAKGAGISAAGVAGRKAVSGENPLDPSNYDAGDAVPVVLGGAMSGVIGKLTPASKTTSDDVVGAVEGALKQGDDEVAAQAPRLVKKPTLKTERGDDVPVPAVSEARLRGLRVTDPKKPAKDVDDAIIAQQEAAEEIRKVHAKNSQASKRRYMDTWTQESKNLTANQKAQAKIDEAAAVDTKKKALGDDVEEFTVVTEQSTKVTPEGKTTATTRLRKKKGEDGDDGDGGGKPKKPRGKKAKADTPPPTDPPGGSVPVAAAVTRTPEQIQAEIDAVQAALRGAAPVADVPVGGAKPAKVAEHAGSEPVLEDIARVARGAPDSPPNVPDVNPRAVAPIVAKSSDELVAALKAREALPEDARSTYDELGKLLDDSDVDAVLRGVPEQDLFGKGKLPPSPDVPPPTPVKPKGPKPKGPTGGGKTRSAEPADPTVEAKKTADMARAAGRADIADVIEKQAGIVPVEAPARSTGAGVPFVQFFRNAEKAKASGATQAKWPINQNPEIQRAINNLLGQYGVAKGEAQREIGQKLKAAGKNFGLQPGEKPTGNVPKETPAAPAAAGREPFQILNQASPEDLRKGIDASRDETIERLAAENAQLRAKIDAIPAQSKPTGTPGAKFPDELGPEYADDAAAAAAAAGPVTSIGAVAEAPAKAPKAPRAKKGAAPIAARTPEQIQAELDAAEVALRNAQAQLTNPNPGLALGTDKPRLVKSPKPEAQAPASPLTDAKPDIKSETGAIDPALAPILGGVAGAATGAAIDEENRARGAVLGAAGGAYGTKAIQAVAGNIARGAPHASPEGFKGAVELAFNTLPQALRFNYLASPNIFANAFVAPYAAGVLKGLELHLAGDPRGAVILREMDPVQWARRIPESTNLAKDLMQEAERGGGPSFAEAGSPLGRLFASPGTLMTGGDLNTRTILMNAGLTEEEARAATLTAEPVFKLTKSLMDAQRSGGPAMQILFPFARTVLNIFDQTLLKTPGVGLVAQHFKMTDPDPWRNQAAQQAIGGAVGLAGGLAGYANADTEDPFTGRILRSIAQNAGGPYAGLASMGYAAGAGLAKGDALPMALKKGARAGIESLPLPTTDVPEGWLNFLMGNARGEHPWPPGSYPMQNYLKDAELPWSVPKPRYQRPPR